MSKILEELKNVRTFYVATAEANGQPRVRPFGAVAEFEGKIYICTNNTKACYKQMIENPLTELCGMAPDGTWIRVTGKLVRDDRDEAREAMLQANEGLRGMYHIGDGIFEVLYLEDPVCVKYSFTAAPQTIE